LGGSAAEVPGPDPSATPDRLPVRQFDVPRRIPLVHAGTAGDHALGRVLIAQLGQSPVEPEQRIERHLVCRERGVEPRDLRMREHQPLNALDRFDHELVQLREIFASREVRLVAAETSLLTPAGRLTAARVASQKPSHCPNRLCALWMLRYDSWFKRFQLSSSAGVEIRSAKVRDGPDS